MSINLDHVISDNPNVITNYDKARISYEFVENFRHHEADFTRFSQARTPSGGRWLLVELASSAKGKNMRWSGVVIFIID